MLSSLLLLLSVVAVFVAHVGAVAPFIPPGCQSDDVQCTIVTFTTKGNDLVTLSFYYDPVTGSTTQGTLCYLTSLVIQGTPYAASGQQISGTVALAGLDVTNIQTSSFNLDTPTGATATIGSSTASALEAGFGTAASIVVKSGKTTTPIAINTGTTFEQCTPGAKQDPHFTGFLGQQFCLMGESGSVFNVLSSSNMQLNTRLVQINEGDALTRAEMRVARMKSLFTLPNTYWFDHAGPYMGELGLAMLNGHQLYAKAGQYINGFSSVQLDETDLAVSDEAVVLGTGADAITVSHPTAHQLIIDTPTVQLTITNSDNFFNIEGAHLKSAFDLQKSPFGGALGQTANPEWKSNNKDAKWRKQVEQDALVESGNLFELAPSAGGAYSS